MNASLTPHLKAVLVDLAEHGDPSVRETAERVAVVSRATVAHLFAVGWAMGLVDKLENRRERIWRINAAGLKAIGRKASRAA